MNMDTEKLLELIKAFYNITGLKVAIYNTDFKEILSYPEKHSRFCTLIRSSEDGARACDLSDELRCRRCAEEKKLIIEKCHAGLTEVTAPLSNGIEIIGYIMFGQVKSNDINFEENILESCKKYALEEKNLSEEIKNISHYSDKQLADCSLIINALVSYIMFSKLAFTAEKPVIVSIIEYISENLKEELTVNSLCERFYISKTELYKISRPFMPDGIADFVKKQRINKAEDLILYTDKSISKIAEEVGFKDENYFRKVFKKEKGISASKYRIDERRKNGKI